MPQSADRPPDLRVFERATRKESRNLLVEHFRTLAGEREALTANAREGAGAARSALRRLLDRDAQFRAEMAPVVARSRDLLTSLDDGATLEAGAVLSREDALRLLSGSGIRGLDRTSTSVMALTMAKDTRADVRVPPYNDAWTHVEGGRHQQQRQWANRADGRFGFVYTIGQEGGWAWSGAGVEVLFMRDQPGSPPGQGAPGLAQVRTFTPYRYAWRDISYLGTAHQHAGFGVLVWSAPLGGGASRVDQNHQYWRWSDGTSWYQDHHNPSFPSTEADTALNYGDQAPYFPIEPGRIYGAWVWCFGAGDASGADFFSAAYAQALIDATARLVVIGQQ